MNLINFLADAVTCGSTTIEGDIVGIIRGIYNAIRIGVPIILIIVGMVGMGKAIAQQKEDEIKKAQSTLIKQAIAAVVVFLMFSIVNLVVGAVASKSDSQNASNWNCVAEILTGKKAGTTGNDSDAKDDAQEKVEEPEESPNANGRQ